MMSMSSLSSSIEVVPLGWEDICDEGVEEVEEQ